MTERLMELRECLEALMGKSSEESTSCEMIVKFLETLQSTVLLDKNRTQFHKDSLQKIQETLNHVECRQRIMSSLDEHSDTIASAYIRTVTSLIQHDMLPSIPSSDDQEYPEKHFETTRKICYISACVINVLLTHIWDCIRERYSNEELIANRIERKILKGCIPSCVVLWASHQDDHPWTDTLCRQATQDLIKSLCNITSANDVPEILCRSVYSSGCKSEDRLIGSGCFVDVLNLLRPSLTRETWKQEPCSRHAFYCCLVQVKHPHLGDHLELVLPPALLFVDDYKVENKILGMRCLHHIINNVDPTELSWYSRSLVIYEALQRHIYNQDPSVLEALYPCLVAILGVVERCPQKANEFRKPTRYDTAFQTILSNMEHEQKLVLRRVHAKCLAEFIDKMGITVLRHMKRLLRVLVNYLEVYDGAEQTARLDVICAMKALITQAWPRIPHYYDVIFKSLLKLLYDVTTCDAQDISHQVQSDIISGTEECLLLLKRCCGTEMDQSLQSLCGCEASNHVIDECLQRVMSGT
ncbi:TELO2-interacting protein 2-like [Amphiura filiformis]|uniref:TELO2-interacting protein 2-like n=1 Tax=Amphiura filiformis TaxID=82378 RepID=UPI003B22836B